MPIPSGAGYTSLDSYELILKDPQQYAKDFIDIGLVVTEKWEHAFEKLFAMRRTYNDAKNVIEFTLKCFQRSEILAKKPDYAQRQKYMHELLDGIQAGSSLLEHKIIQLHNATQVQ